MSGDESLSGNTPVSGLEFDRADGRALWRQEVGVAFNASHRDDLAAPSPVVDAEVVIAAKGKQRGKNAGDLVFRGKVHGRNDE